MNRKYSFISCMAFFILIFFSGCGLDNYYYLDMPYNDGHMAYYSSSDEINNYFSCITNEQSGTGVNYEYFSSSSDFSFLGTEIYYKIYNNYEAMQNVEGTVSSMISNTSTYTSATEYLISTGGYKTLRLNYGSISPLIKRGAAPQNRYVYIRLNSYQNNPEYQSGICVGSSAMNVWSDAASLKYNGQNVFPRRSNSSYGFNFSRSDKANPIPKSDDDDVTYSATSTEENVWYVDMYAVSVGRDSTYTESYSQPYFMGSITISVRD